MPARQTLQRDIEGDAICIGSESEMAVYALQLCVERIAVRSGPEACVAAEEGVEVVVAHLGSGGGCIVQMWIETRRSLR
jgi:predicted TIM-barrel enzyme